MNGVILSRKRKEFPMFVVVTVISLSLLLAMAGVDMLVDGISSDELTNMGVEKKA
jgi:hypothetical protein